MSVCGCVFFLRCRPVGGAQGLMMAAYCRNTVAFSRARRHNQDGHPSPSARDAWSKAGGQLRTLWPPVREGVLGPKSCERPTWRPLASSQGGMANPAPSGMQPGRGCSARKVADGQLGDVMASSYSGVLQGGDARSKKLRTANLRAMASSQRGDARSKALHGKPGCEWQTWRSLASSRGGGARSEKLRTADLAPRGLQLERG